MNNWVKKDEMGRRAMAHTEMIAERYAAEVAEAVRRSVVCTEDSAPPWSAGRSTTQLVTQGTSTQALFSPDLTNKHVCVLNFASFKNPGGGFLTGSTAQEESLCHDSTLFNVLKEFDDTFYAANRRMLNRGMYVNRALYTPGVRFMHAGAERLADVLTCAAPNYSVALKYGSFTAAENMAALRGRVNFVKGVIAQQRPDVVILGAWGCGVFKQDPRTVAALWATGGVPADLVIHAVPDTSTYRAFRDVLGDE